MEPIDLHVHSTRSDGTCSPAELVDYAMEKGLAAFALTDHDTVAGLDEAIGYAEKLRQELSDQTSRTKIPESDRRFRKVPEVIPGIEFSTEYSPTPQQPAASRSENAAASSSSGLSLNLTPADIPAVSGERLKKRSQDVHIVGLDIDYHNPAFVSKLQEFVDSRTARNNKMCRLLQEAGIDITYEALLGEFPDAVITRAHYAKYMLNHGYIKSIKEAFDKYVGDGCPYYVPREKVTPKQAVELILKAGGIPILAHPILYHMSNEELDVLTKDLKAAGLIGIEAIYSTYKPHEERKIRKIAAKYDLCISGGSDFHGTNKPDIDLGTGYGHLFVPYDVLTALRARKHGLTTRSCEI